MTLLIFYWSFTCISNKVFSGNKNIVVEITEMIHSPSAGIFSAILYYHLGLKEVLIVMILWFYGCVIIFALTWNKIGNFIDWALMHLLNTFFNVLTMVGLFWFWMWLNYTILIADAILLVCRPYTKDGRCHFSLCVGILRPKFSQVLVNFIAYWRSRNVLSLWKMW